MYSVLYISFSKREPEKLYLDASVRYRCIFPAEAINHSGSVAHVIHYTQLKKIDLAKYQTVICHRPRYGKTLRSILKLQNKHNFELVSDWDDLLFNPTLAEQSPAYLSGQLTLNLSKKYASNYLKALKLFNKAIVSTGPLAKQLLAVHQNCQVETQYNKVPRRWVDQTQKGTNERLKHKVIRYFPGTSHHLNNFKQISSFLSKYLHKHKDVNLEVVGDLNFDTSQFPKDQIKKSPYVIFEDLPNLINDSWVTLAPLENNIFNQCKSGLKFWESGLFGVPVIASPNPDMARFVNDGLLLSDDFKVWEIYLDRLQAEPFYKQASAKCTELAEQAISISQDFNQTKTLALTSKIGPDWPLTLLNPAQKEYKENLKLFKKITSMDVITDKPESLNSSAKDKRLYYLTPKPKRLRKLKKLINNPKLFFKDMIRKL